MSEKSIDALRAHRAPLFAAGEPRTIEAAKKGAQRSAEVRTARKTMREDLVAVLGTKLKNPEVKKDFSAFGIKAENIQQATIAATLIAIIKSGDANALYKIAQLIGEAEAKDESGAKIDAIIAELDAQASTLLQSEDAPTESEEDGTS